jgi:hypothetical protein
VEVCPEEAKAHKYRRAEEGVYPTIVHISIRWLWGNETERLEAALGYRFQGRKFDSQ